jgi:uncharacterized protein
MKKSTTLKPKFETEDPISLDYLHTVQDLFHHPDVRSMDHYLHHGNVTCFEHCHSVSYYSYRLASHWNLNQHAAARGGLLHDFYLYDWHKKQNRKGLHGFTHARSSLANAQLRFSLTPIEKDIILKHMWPMQPKLPRYKESFLVCFVDKKISLMETAHLIYFKPIQWMFPTITIIYPK